MHKVLQDYILKNNITSCEQLYPAINFVSLILKCGDPNFFQIPRINCGLNSSISYAYDFFDYLDSNYSSYFLDRLYDDTFIFKQVSKNSYEQSCSYYDVLREKNKIYIPYKKHIYDSFAVVHEITHDMNLCINNIGAAREVFSEFISTIMEFFYEDFLVDNYNFKDINNKRFIYNACFIKALIVDFELKLLCCFIDKRFSFSNIEKIMNSYGKYNDFIKSYYEKILVGNELQFDVEIRYIIGILFSAYSYELYLNKKIDLSYIKYINDNLNSLSINEICSILDLEVCNSNGFELTTGSYELIGSSYRRLMKVI